MKKKILLALTLVALFICLFAITINAEAMTHYIEFDVMLDGNTELTRVYVEPLKKSDGTVDMYTVYVPLGYDFYTDLEKTTKVEKTNIVAIDMSNIKAYGYSNNNIKQLSAASDNSSYVNVKDVKLPNYPGNFNYIANKSFKGFTSLETIDFGSAYQTGDNAFEGCTGLKELVIPESVTKLNNNTFINCTGITKLTILGSTTIDSAVFKGCTSLTDVNLGQIPKIGAGMFQDCTSLTEITIPETVTSIGSTAFMGTSITSLHIPAAVTSIGYQVAEDVTTLTTLTFAEGSKLVEIGHRSFQRTGLTGDIVIPNGVTNIKYSAFASTAITSIELPNTLTTMGTGVFSDCTSLEEVVGFESTQITKLESSTFKNCSSLTSLEIPSTVTSTGNEVFYGCTNLTLDIDFSSYTTIGEKAFQGYTGQIGELDISNATKISNNAFYGCTGITSIKFSSNLTEIGAAAFQNCTNLTTIDLPASLTAIGSSAFRGTGITSVVFPDSITSISTYMFEGCKSLTSVSIPAGFTKIGEKAFQNCNAITSLTFRGNAGTNAIIDIAAFESCYTIGVVTIPEGVVTLGNCAFNASGVTHLTLPSTLTTVNGNSTFNVWGKSQITNDYKLKSVTGLENTKITTIVYAMFRGQSKWAPEMITLPNTVTKIDTYAFADVAMTNVSLGAGLENLANEAFTACVNLKNVYMPGTITTFGSTPFYNRGTHFFVTSENTDYLATIQSKAGTTSVVSYADYVKNPDDYTSGKWVIYGCNICDTFYAGIHDKDVETQKFVGQAYVTDFVNASTCKRCDIDFIVSTICGPLFDDLGYSTEDEGTAFAYAISVDQTNLATYLANVENKTLVYGFIVGLYAENITDIITAEGESLISNSLVVDFTDPSYDNLNRFELKFTKITNGDLQLYCNGYVSNGTSVSYIGSINEETLKPVAVTFNGLKSKED